MLSLRGQRTWLLWLLALAVLCFAASLFPELRRRLWWSRSEDAAPSEPG